MDARSLLLFAAAAIIAASASAQTPPDKLTDTHIHYSHDAWQQTPPAKAIAILREAGVTQAWVSASGEGGAVRLWEEAPDLIVPLLRPYRKRGELNTWFNDLTVVDYVERRLSKHNYAAIGEFHIYGEDADSEVMRRMVTLAREHKIFLHIHGDADAVNRVFQQNPQARILWAHAGFVGPDELRPMLTRHKNLWCDLSFREGIASGKNLEQEWLELFKEFPLRFTIGADTYTPGRWSHIKPHANWARAWLSELPPDLAKNIAHRNAETLLNSNN